MAKVTSPFMSLDASGTFGGAITASKWKGRNYMRLRIDPANPQTTGQQAVRSVLGTLAKAAHAVLTSFADELFAGSQFFQDARDMAPSGQSWISWLQKTMYPLFAAAVTAYGALDGTHKGYWTTSAGDTNLASYTDKSGATHTVGEQLYLLAKFAVSYLGYDGFASGIDAANGTETDAFAEYVAVSTEA